MYLLFIFTFLACSDDKIDDQLSDSNTIDIVFVNGKLHFNKRETLIDFLEKTTVNEFEQTILGFQSLGFKPLLPIFIDENDAEIDEFLKRKSNDTQGSTNGIRISDEDIDLSDTLIASDDFASLLNEDREIYVDDKYYIYTSSGLYFSDIEKESYLNEYLTSIDHSSSRFSNGCNDNPVISADVHEGAVTEIDNEISHFTVSCGSSSDQDDYSYGGTSGNTGSSTNNTDEKPPLLEPQSFGLCVYSENSLFQQVFGNTVKCNDYHDSTHRIQTKVFNENYFLWSNIGVSAKYQKKRFIGWSRSGTSDGVVLGINRATYTYEDPLSPYNALDPNRVIFKYAGTSYDIMGNVIPDYPINPKSWPFNPRATLGALEVTILGQEVYYPISGADANESINQLLSQARGVVPGLNDDLNDNEVGVNIVKYLPNKFKVAIADVVETAPEKAKKVFDVNFLLTYNSNTTNNLNLQAFAEQLNAKKYDEYEIDMYGAGLRGGIWKGKRIIGSGN